MKQVYPLTHPQKRIWYVEKAFPGTGVSNIAATVRIKENIDYAALEKALNHVVKNNDAVRTRIIEEGGHPLQYYADFQPFKVDFIDFSGRPIEELYQWDSHLSRQPMRLIDSDLFYFATFKISDSEGGFYSKLHHVITDAWSEMVLYSQIMTAYRAYSEGRDPESVDNPSYLDYIRREKEYQNSDKHDRDREYWMNKFTPVPDLVSLQTKKNMKKNIAARRKAFVVTTAEAARIREFCKGSGITVFSFFLTMLVVYMNRIAGTDDVVLGSPVLNRLNAMEKGMVGMFISTVPLRFSVNESSRLIDYAREINSSWISILRHQQYPFDSLLKDIRKVNSQVENLFEITISYQNAKTSKNLLLWDGSTRWHFSGFQNEPLIIHINDRDDDGTLILNFDYNTSCFAEREIEFIFTHLKCLIADAIDHPEKPIHQLNAMDSEERGRIMAFNSISDNYNQSHTTFTELLEKQVDLTPNATAVVCSNRSITYDNIDKAANRMAHFLRQNGVNRNDIVAVMLPRSVEMMTSILGVVKSGGAFLPVDSSYPKERVRFLLENSNVKLVITTRELASRFSVNQRSYISPNSRRVKESPSWRPQVINEPEDLVYIIYTSGSTGLPKGAMIKHSGLYSFVNAIREPVKYRPGGAVLSIGTISFDIFILEVFPSLVNGMKVVIANESEQRIPALQKGLIRRHRISNIFFTPIHMQLLLDEPDSRECCSCLEEVMVAGDVFPPSLLQRMKELMNAEILNGYGPTETTVVMACKNLTHTNEITIGRPTSNSRVYILDRHMQIVPIGVPGEIFIGGECLSLGYLNNPELTNQRFVPDPFNPGARLYRTGDLGRWYPRGEIAFLGRIDTQVKVRGLRIELGEIESALRRHPAIADTVVLSVEVQGKKNLCAYVVPKPGESIDFPSVRKSLLKILPRFMIPPFFIQIDAIPLNSNGKADRRALPLPGRVDIHRYNYDPPISRDELKLAEIWEQLLGVHEIGINENFFDLGGDSLDAITLVTAINSEFEVEFLFNDVYEFPTVKNQIARISELRELGDQSSYRNIVPLHRGTTDNHVFLAHAGSGDANVYYKLCQRLFDNENYQGIRYLQEGEGPRNTSIADLAAFYLDQVFEIQPKGPYVLAGWCLGGTIAYEMVRQLEETGREVSSLTLINTICPRTWEGIAPFDIETEQKVLASLLSAEEFKLLQNTNTLEKLWDKVNKLALSGRVSEQNIRPKIPKEASDAIPNFENANAVAILRYLNNIRTLHNARSLYFPPGKIKTRVNYIGVTANDVITDQTKNISGWQKYCAGEIYRLVVEGDHFSIFRKPDVDGLAKAFKICITKK
ncbi:MAG: amino acid adenylation domain-containing protein [Firmicutes bacterium]|nr:amino acid adenylation domain-containing protein [Bacillota bacterium]